MSPLDRVTELLEQTSRTFALGIRQLPDSLERAVSVAYLTLRVSDYFEDNEAMSGPDKVAYLKQWANCLDHATSGGPYESLALPTLFDESTTDAEAAKEAALILRAFADLGADARTVVGKHVAASTRGMAEWVERGPDFATESDLDAYMYEVAGRVGELLTDLFSLRSPTIARRRDEMTRLGVEFGLGLQTVNVIRGLSTDPSRGWIFVPRTFLADPAAPEEPWADPGGEAAMALLDRLVDKARRHLDAAVEYTLGVPRREYGIRIFCLLPLLFAVRTVEKSRGNPAVYSAEVKLTRPEVTRIASRTKLLAMSNAWIRAAAAG